MKRIVSFFGERTEIFERLNERAEVYAASKGLQYVWSEQCPYNRQKVIGQLQQADAGIIDVEPYGEEIFSQIKDSTKILVRFGVGYDKVDLKAASKNGIAIARTTGANTTAVAEMALSLMLAAKRHICVDNEMVRSGKWEKDVVGGLTGATVGIIGLGAIGKRLARLLSGFDCRILAYTPHPKAEDAKTLSVEFVDLDTLLRESDAISVHVPLNESTKNLIDREALAKMKADAVLVNTSRGGIVDEQALYEALRDRKIGGAGIDVFASEPLPMDSPLRSLDNIILTPHNSSQTVEALWNIYKMAIDIAADFFEGTMSPHILNPDFAEAK